MQSRLDYSMRWLALALWFAAAPLGAASPEPLGISVNGVGVVKVQPTRMQIDLTAEGSAELTGDALVKYRASLQRIRDAFEKLKLKNLTIAERGLSIENSGAAQAAAQRFNGNAPTTTKAKTEITRGLCLELTGLKDLSEEQLTDVIGKLLDTAKDAGATLGGDGGAAQTMARIYGQQLSASSVMFVVDDFDVARQSAYEQAFKQARSRAERLAALADSELGRVLSIEESTNVPEDESSQQVRVYAAVYGWNNKSNKDETQIKSDKLGEIPVSVILKVRFDILPIKVDHAQTSASETKSGETKSGDNVTKANVSK